MTFPKPTHEDIIHPSNEIQDYSNIASARAYAALRNHLKYNTFMFGGSLSEIGDGRTNRKVHGYTPQGVIIESEADTTRGSSGEIIPDEFWAIRLFSFTAPVEDTKKKLIEIIKSSANI